MQNSAKETHFFIHLSICLFVLALHALIIKDITLSEELKVEHIELTWTRALRRRKSIFLKKKSLSLSLSQTR